MSGLRLAFLGFFLAWIGAAWALRALAPAQHARLVAALTPGSATEVPFSRWAILGALVLAGDLAWSEWREPFYFVQDDALVGELPSVLLGFRALWSGHFPAFDPYVYMGAPLASFGLSSFTYPPAYAAFAIARYVVGRDDAVLDVFGCLHLLGGYFAMEKAGRTLGAGRLTAPIAALSFTLSGSVLMMGRAWHMMTAAALWTPLLALCVIRLTRGQVGWRWAFGTGACVGVWFHVGFTQVWFYGVFFSALAVLLLFGAKAIGWREIGWCAIAILIGVAIAAPLLVSQIVEASSVIPRGDGGHGIGHGLLALLLPWPLVSAPHPEHWGNDHPEWMGTLEYFGTTFALVALVMVSLFTTFGPSRRFVAANVWLFVGLGAFALALGPPAGAWTLLAKAPGLKVVSHDPFRLLPFFIAYVSLAGAPFLERVIAGSRSPRLSGYVIAAMTTGLVLWNARLAPSNYTYGFRPYPALAPAFAARIGAEGEANRVMAVTHYRSPIPSFGQSLTLNLSVVSGTFSVDGYDPIVESSPPWPLVLLSFAVDPIRSARAYGVRYFLVDRSIYAPVLSKSIGTVGQELYAPWRGMTVLVRSEPFAKVAEDENFSLYELPGASPLAFRTASPEIFLPFDASAEGLRIAIPPPGGEVVLNFLARPLMVARIGERRVPLVSDPWGRVRADIPPEGGTLTVTYEAPWRLGLGGGAAIAALAFVCARALTRVTRLRDERAG